MKYEPLARSLIATSLALSCLMAHAASVAPVAAENGMVAPFGTSNFALASNAAGLQEGQPTVQYEAINDFGGRRTLNMRLLD